MTKMFITALFSLYVTLAVYPADTGRFRPFFAHVPKSVISTEIPSSDEGMLNAVRIAEARAFKRFRRLCWRAVKNAMMEAKVIFERPTTRYAKQAGEELVKKFGFKKIDVTDPFDAPVGAVLVYGGRGAGHVEFRTTVGFVSDAVSDRPSRRPLIGVYVRI